MKWTNTIAKYANINISLTSVQSPGLGTISIKDLKTQCKSLVDSFKVSNMTHLYI